MPMRTIMLTSPRSPAVGEARGRQSRAGDGQCGGRQRSQAWSRTSGSRAQTQPGPGGAGGDGGQGDQHDRVGRSGGSRRRGWSTCWAPRRPGGNRGRSATHIRAIIAVPATAEIRSATPLMTATPTPSRPSMNSQSAPAGARPVVEGGAASARAGGRLRKPPSAKPPHPPPTPPPRSDTQRPARTNQPRAPSTRGARRRRQPPRPPQKWSAAPPRRAQNGGRAMFLPVLARSSSSSPSSSITTAAARAASASSNVPGAALGAPPPLRPPPAVACPRRARQSSSTHTSTSAAFLGELLMPPHAADGSRHAARFRAPLSCSSPQKLGGGPRAGTRDARAAAARTGRTWR